MRSRWKVRTKVLLPVVAAALVHLGCGDTSVIELSGPTLPLSNQRIVSQSTHGTPGQNSSIYGLYDDGGRGIYFKGLLDGNNVVGKLSNTGQMIWSNSHADRVRGVYPVPDNNIGLAEGIIWVGGHDTDGDDNSDEARIGLTGAGGAEIDEWLISRPDTALWLNAVDRMNDLTFVAVGGALTTAGTYYPYVATFEIGPDSSLALLNETIFEAAQGRIYGGLKLDPDEVVGGEFTCYTTTASAVSDADPQRISVQAFRGSTSDVSAYEIDWTVDLPWSDPLDMWTYLDAIELFDGSVYVVGAGDVAKTDPSGTVGRWSAGFIGSVSATGVLNWLHVSSLSSYNDEYYNIRVTSDVLFASGVYGRHSTSPNSRRYGLALISEFDRATGAERYHLGFGGIDYSSGFNAMLPKGSHTICAGWTNHSQSGSGFPAWFTEVTLGGIGEVGGRLLPELPAGGERADTPGRGVSCGDSDRPVGR